jgi:hypothetical protein
MEKMDYLKLNWHPVKNASSSEATDKITPFAAIGIL